MPAVVFTDVTKRYADGTEAVAEFNLSIADGEYVCLLGPSGCGKSSTLRMLAGLETVSGGEISLNGRRLNDVPPQSRDMAMVFENYALYPHLDVFDNIAMPLAARRVPRAEIWERVAAVAETLQIGSMLKMRPYQLSGGQRQRVSIGRAIVRQPKMFLMDEPLGHLEAYLRLQLRAEIRRLHERLRVTTVHITHDQEEASAVSDRIAVMNNGRLQQVGTIVDLLDEPANRFVAEFIGSPPINVLPATLESAAGGGFALKLGAASIPLAGPRWAFLGAATKGAVAAGFRPEHLKLTDGENGVAAQVVEIEPQGGESVVVAEAAELGRVSSFVPSNRAPAVGSQVRVLPDADRLHLFDHAGISLRAAPAGRVGAAG